MATFKEYLAKLIDNADTAHSEKETELERIQETIDKLEKFQAEAEEVSQGLESLSILQEELVDEHDVTLDK